ncbi:triose-phosphate transporter family-domain-containing protein [Exophiala viscosa]|uniref:Triose-phosphate transporter family-domain-containing protein n=1 Tax=Exophiala viscosa TaxID=2486360 RepID=A0AAN6IBX8_9EURO|nr:triose-phosphate transporter family-domain-containing protein [Exophiala viscosa]
MSLRPEATQPKVAMEYSVPTTKKFTALFIYFLCNVGLTLYNKAVLGSFPYPWLLTALHAGCSSVGCYVLLHIGYFKLSTLAPRDAYVLSAFSFLFTLNIAISNVSLGMVSIPFHQVVRATTPLVTMGLYRVMYGRTYTRATCLSLIPVILGVAFATFGDYSYTTWSFLITFLGVVLGAFKTITTNQIMTGSLKLEPLEFLLRMSPFACLQSLIYSIWSGEISRMLAEIDQISSYPMDQIRYAAVGIFIIFLGNGVLAFCLNISSFTTNKLVGALTMTVCGNVKQCMTIILGVVLFHVHIGALNALGLFITTCGAAVYSFVELHLKSARQKQTSGTGTV